MYVHAYDSRLFFVCKDPELLLYIHKNIIVASA